MNLFNFILGSKDQEIKEDPEPELSNSILSEYIANLGIKSDFARLEGPFLCENYALKYIDIYSDLLKRTYHLINLCISRPIALISSDTTLDTMDNARVEIGIVPYNHRLEIAFYKNDFSVVGVDGNILLNKYDAERIKTAMMILPITEQELKNGLTIWH